MLSSMRRFLAGMGLVTVFAISGGSAALAQDTVLTVTHDGEALTFDREALEALGTETIETSTIWTEGTRSFEGVSLARLMREVGVQEGKLIATAVNDYSVEIPLSDAVENGPMIAMKMDGAELSLRDKGPLWVIYPYDSKADYRSEVIFSRSIGQLDRLEVVE
ncbi:molybdopterin-dependent oxidoreductase [Sulfitobacter sp.]|uniref:molybdopterin-dependent oxidoreductase n=1 Tax=Sulfitobacter sp. TaxID=1903071 RepID=UPI003001773E